mmetsp:Transcript_126716/g.370281  ORF Transcript_126716/g.370281 Transcript_126716/m.370281 type:complete len:351 (-) Transcript_126716:114-1166(-)
MPPSPEAAAAEAVGTPSRSPSSAARAGVSDGAAADGALKSQVVQVSLTNGSTDIRLAELDLEAGRLVLWQLTRGETGEVELGGQASIKLASIGEAAVQGSSVSLRAGGPSGRVLVCLKFGEEPLARTWAVAIRRGSASARGEAPQRVAASAEAQGEEEGSGKKSPVEMLRILLRQLHQQAELMDAINKRKESTLLELQGELEWALEQLQRGQEDYARQQRELESQQQLIEGLRRRTRSAGVAGEAACAAGTTGASPSRRPPSALASALAGQPAGSALPGAGSGGKASLQGSAAAFSKDAEEQTKLQLLEKLRDLEDEKGRLERELQGEQGEIQQQLHELQGMLSTLGTQG